MTPKILMLSGIGPKDELAHFGIECERNLPGVGKNLQSPILTPLGTVNKSGRSYYEGYSRNQKELANRDWFTSNSGPHASLGIDVYASVRTDTAVSVNVENAEHNPTLE